MGQHLLVLVAETGSLTECTTVKLASAPKPYPSPSYALARPLRLGALELIERHHSVHSWLENI